eukprot:COSAG01_NODE_2504_length_7555_cov_3.189646_8_plen_115_part_00
MYLCGSGQWVVLCLGRLCLGMVAWWRVAGGGGGGGGGGPRTRGPLRAGEVDQIELRERGAVEGSAHAQPQHGVRAARVGVDGVGAGAPPRRAAAARLLRVAATGKAFLTIAPLN